MKGLAKAGVWGLAVAVLLVSGGQLPACVLAVVLGAWALKA